LVKAAESGNLKANGAIGLMYLSGVGTDKDIEKGLHYIELSAIQGDVHSQYNLAMLFKGQMEIDLQEQRSTYWLKEAAARGFGPAQIDLAISYLQGIGVEKDYAEGFKWSLLGKINGDKRADSLIEYCNETLDELSLKTGKQRADLVTSTHHPV
jgi:TPR repeat protein